MREVERIAYGPLDLRPDEFWATTPAELAAMNDGALWRLERSRELIAWQASIVIAPHVPKHQRPSIDDLLGRSQTLDPIAKEAQFTVLWERVERQRRGEI